MKHTLNCMLIALLVAWVNPVFGQVDAQRQWSDATGKFNVQASLIAVRGQDVFLETADGKTMKIPLSRLSQADQDFLKGDSNPFEEVGGAMPNQPATATPAAAASASDFAGSSSAAQADNAPVPWSEPWNIDWDQVELMESPFDTQWNYTPPATVELPFEAKRATLPKKTNFFEGMRRLEINPLAQRAVVGYTVTFSVPKPLSRISIIDLPSGKSLQSEAIESNMSPLAVLNDGATVLMQGSGKEREDYETPDQLQIWRMQGKKIVRSGIWQPFAAADDTVGRRRMGSDSSHVNHAMPIADNKIMLLSKERHLACFDVRTRQAIWHTRLKPHYALDYSLDRTQLFLLDDQTLMVVDPSSGKVLSSLSLEGQPRLSWPRICLNPAGDQLLLTYGNDFRVIDLSSGTTGLSGTITTSGPLAANGLSFLNDDYALLDNRLLLHLPSQIMVCEYKDAAQITSVGGVEFVGLLGDQGGLVVPTSIPHPKAKETLAKAVNDPGVFLIHPGVSVSLNVTGVGGEYQAQVETALRQAAEKAGYKVVSNAEISIVAAVSGPTPEGVSYIARGTYVINKYTTDVRLVWNGKNVWSRGGSNVPGMLSLDRDQTIQQKLDELGKKPNISFFDGVSFPKLLQAPQEGQQGQNSGNALLVSKFTLQGLVDSK